MKRNILASLTAVSILGLGLSVTFTGCAGKASGTAKVEESELVIPDFPDAKTQFNFAKTYQNSMIVAPDLARRKGQMAKSMQCYQRVITNFPNDTVYVPLTYLEMGDCEAQSENVAGAIAYYERAQSSTSDEFVQSRAQYSIARMYNVVGRYAEAKAMFKTVMDSFGNSTSGRVRDVVKRSAAMYYKVIDPSEKPKA